MHLLQSLLQLSKDLRVLCKPLQAYALLEKAVALGSPEALGLLSLMLLDSEGGVENSARGVEVQAFAAF